jgi:hypothetical protein
MMRLLASRRARARARALSRFVNPPGKSRPNDDDLKSGREKKKLNYINDSMESPPPPRKGVDIERRSERERTWHFLFCVEILEITVSEPERGRPMFKNTNVIYNGIHTGQSP